MHSALVALLYYTVARPAFGQYQYSNTPHLFLIFSPKTGSETIPIPPGDSPAFHDYHLSFPVFF